jgi:hypothetical protein
MRLLYVPTLTFDSIVWRTVDQSPKLCGATPRDGDLAGEPPPVYSGG